jgi:hypothetical protein
MLANTGFVYMCASDQITMSISRDEKFGQNLIDFDLFSCIAPGSILNCSISSHPYNHPDYHLLFSF